MVGYGISIRRILYLWECYGMKEKELHSSLQSSGTEISWMVRIHAGQETGGSDGLLLHGVYLLLQIKIQR